MELEDMTINYRGIVEILQAENTRGELTVHADIFTTLIS
jgi:hypothetical protein